MHPHITYHVYLTTRERRVVFTEDFMQITLQKIGKELVQSQQGIVHLGCAHLVPLMGNPEVKSANFYTLLILYSK